MFNATLKGADDARARSLAETLSIGVQTGPPIGAQKDPLYEIELR